MRLITTYLQMSLFCLAIAVVFAIVSIVSIERLVRAVKRQPGCFPPYYQMYDDTQLRLPTASPSGGDEGLSVPDWLLPITLYACDGENP